MERPPELLKSFAGRLSQLASSEDGKQFLRMLRLSNFVGNGSSRAGSDDLSQMHNSRSAHTALPERVGIWERRKEDGKTVFVRSMDMMKDWNYWANVGRIEAKGTKQRIILLGESVARGYLYDPQYTPAMVLEKILQSQWGSNEIEVLDLARTNLGLDVGDLALAALALEPDAMIIFSGNNWRGRFPPQTSDLPYIDTLMREQGLAGPKRYAEEQLDLEVRRVVNAVASVYGDEGVPVVWVIPEFNLGDWRDPLANAPHLPNGRNEEWLTLWEEAQQILSMGDYRRAATVAQRMTEIDAGTQGASLYLLAECSQKLDDLDAVRRYLELARDSLIGDPSKSGSPRIFSVTQKALREEIAKYGNEIVDMPELFRLLLKGGIPDRRLFLDYCHLTSEGIQITMAATASRLLHVLNKADVAWSTLMPQAYAPSPEIEAEAALLAAVHNAHWWQSADLVRYYCAKSIRSSPKIAKVMDSFIDLQTRRTPMLMCRSAQRISELGSPLIQHYLLRYNNQQLDEVLLSGVVEALRQLNIDANPELDRLRKDEHSVASRNINLLEYYYCSAALQPLEVFWALPRRDRFARPVSDFYKAYWLESKFVFIGEAQLPVKLQITLRIPAAAATAKPVEIRLNGHFVTRMLVGREWEAWDITVSGEIANEGINEIVFRWPMPEFPGKAGYLGVIDDLADGNMPELSCVFGEIHTFTASDGRETEMSRIGLSVSTAMPEETLTIAHEAIL